MSHISLLAGFGFGIFALFPLNWNMLGEGGKKQEQFLTLLVSLFHHLCSPTQYVLKKKKKKDLGKSISKIGGLSFYFSDQI